MALHLVTGYGGSDHITSNDEGAYNIATYGSGQFVLNRGNKFSASILSNNSIQINDGEALMQGRFIRLNPNTTENVTIENGTTGMYRNDLIVIRYTENSSTGVESADFVVIKGTESSTSATDPSYTSGDITDGTDTVNDMPLYRVSLNGISIDSITALFTIKKSMIDYTPPTATSSTLGMVKTGSNISNSNGTISVPTASTSTLGVMKVGSGLSVSNGVVSNGYSLPTASSSTLGGVKVGSGLAISSGVLSAKHSTKKYEVFAKSKVTIASKDYELVDPSVVYSGDIVIFEPAPHFVPLYGLEDGKMSLDSTYYVNDWSSSVTVAKGDSIGYIYVINFS